MYFSRANIWQRNFFKFPAIIYAPDSESHLCTIIRNRYYSIANSEGQHPVSVGLRLSEVKHSSMLFATKMMSLLFLIFLLNLLPVTASALPSFRQLSKRGPTDYDGVCCQPSRESGWMLMRAVRRKWWLFERPLIGRRRR